MGNQNPGFYGGLVPQFSGQGKVDTRLVSTSEQGQGDGPNYRYGGLLTYEKPIKEWFPDLALTPGQGTLLRAGIELPVNCVQVRFINVAGTPTVSINGYGARTLLNLDGYNNTEIQSMYVILGATDTCTVQSAGTGD